MTMADLSLTGGQGALDPAWLKLARSQPASAADKPRRRRKLGPGRPIPMAPRSGPPCC